MEWTFRRKEEWLVRKGVTYSSSVGSARYMFFLANASSRVNTFGQLIGCALLLDNKIIATQISLLNPHMTENIHIAYDFAYARFSPGLLLDRYVLQWAFERGIAYDFHFGTDDRKRALGNANCECRHQQLLQDGMGLGLRVPPALQKCATRSAIAQMVVPFRSDASNHDPSRQMVHLPPATRILV